MNPGNEDPLYAPIDAKLASILEAAPASPGWSESWRRLRPDSPWGERLKVYQAIRDSGLLPEDAGFFLVSRHVDALADEQVDEALRRLQEEMTAIERKHGLTEDEYWSPGEAPVEYERVREQYQDAWDAFFADRLDECGEKAMAQLLRTDREAFERRTEAGRRFFFEPILKSDRAASPWLDSLVEGIAAHITVDTACGPLRYRCLEEDGSWEVVVYPSPVELIGGAMDGEIVAPGFSLDLEGCRPLFDRIVDSGWSALGSPSEGPFIWIEGICQNHEVFLRVLAHAPEDEEPGMKIDASRGGPG